MSHISFLNLSLLKTYLKRLTNLTSRNRSLLLLNLPQRQFFDLHSLDFVNQKPSFDLVAQLLEQKRSIKLCAVLDPRFEKNNELSKQLAQVARTQRLIEEERGAEDLYVGYPFIKGKLNDGTVVRCPLLFFPVSLIQKNNEWILEKREADISLNRSFLLAYAHFNQQKVEDELLEQSFEDFSKNTLEFRTQLYEFLKESMLEINFNQELFTDKLIDSEKLTKTELEESERKGELKLYQQAVLGIFPQAGSYLVPDYEELINSSELGGSNELRVTSCELGESYELRVASSELGESNEIETPNSLDTRYSILDTKIKEESLLLPFAVDASQEMAVQWVKQGKSMVVQGPPGTGKSQLICNLIADFTAAKKRVLVVCQKRAALDTVYARLKQVKLENFVGLVHDFRNDRKAIFEKIGTQIEQIEDYKKQNSSLDAIFLERNFTQISRRIDQISTELQSFKDALFDESLCGKSVKELYLTYNTATPKVDLSAFYKSFNFNEIADFTRKTEQFEAYQKHLNDGSEAYHFWQKRLSMANRSFSDFEQFKQVFQQIKQWFEAFAEQLKNLIIDVDAFDDINTDSLRNLLQLIDNEQILLIFNKLIHQKKWKVAQLKPNKIANWVAELNQIISIAEPDEVLLKSTQFDDDFALYSQAIAEGLEASKSVLRKASWQLFSKNKNTLLDLLKRNRLSFQSADLQLLNNKIIATKRYKTLLETLEKYQLETSLLPAELYRNLEITQQALAAFDVFKEELKPLHSSVLIEQKSLADLREFGQILQTLHQQKKANLAAWRQWFSLAQIEILTSPSKSPSPEEMETLLIEYLRQKIDFLIEIDQLKQTFSHTETSVVDKLLECGKSGFTEIFLQSLSTHWIANIEQQSPILRGVDTLKIAQLEEELQQNVVQKQALSQEILLLKLRENTYKDLTINRLSNVVSYRELLHQVSKKKRVWSIRKVIEKFEDEVFKLVPCWLASPESVSALFPLDMAADFQSFDLVIFDEASQCFAEQGIPALVRGKQVVIAGDSKQLQPNDLYQVRFEEEHEDEPILEIDSLLDLAAQQLPQMQLTGHYRSKSLDLIDFSNRYFYKNSLSLLPDFEEVNKNEPHIQYLQVGGVWQKNQNEEEAQKVLEIIADLSQQHPEKSIGVVTFNYKQADLIERKLEQNGKINSHVSVKNIENIQGDEFDFVIFSVGYAPDAKGKLLMNFGNLNQAGGENRLNVAVTRAKEKIFVVCSILPQQLQVENAQNEGPKLLKSYLQYAFDVSAGNYQPQPKVVDAYKYGFLLKDKIASPLPLKGTLQYVKELPFADITVKQGSRYESLLLTDDDLYFSARSPKEAHAYLPLLLKQKGWKVERRWSRGYFSYQT